MARSSRLNVGFKTGISNGAAGSSVVLSSAGMRVGEGATCCARRCPVFFHGVFPD